MRIKNIEIVALATAELVNAGTITADEEIHTFQKWKSLGYAVKRGEKAITKLTIWKHTSRVNAETQEEETAMFMKTAAFFSTSQVEKIKPVKRVSAAEMIGKKCVITLR